jgi:probable HAF family extracellular repeat protein
VRESSSATSINTQGQVAGWSYAPDNNAHAFVHTDGKLYDLNYLVVNDLAGAVLSGAAINERGQIVARSCPPSFSPPPPPQCKSFRLDPVDLSKANVPTLSEWAIFLMSALLGLLGMLTMSRRQA